MTGYPRQREVCLYQSFGRPAGRGWTLDSGRRGWAASGSWVGSERVVGLGREGLALDQARGGVEAKPGFWW